MQQESLSRQSKQNQVNLFHQQSRWLHKGRGLKEGRGKYYKVVGSAVHFKPALLASGKSINEAKPCNLPQSHSVAQITFVIVTVMRIEFSPQHVEHESVTVCVCVCNLPVANATPTTTLTHVAHTPPHPTSTGHLKCLEAVIEFLCLDIELSWLFSIGYVAGTLKLCLKAI